MLKRLYVPPDNEEPPPAKRVPTSVPLGTTLAEMNTFTALIYAWQRCMTHSDVGLAFSVAFTCRYARVNMDSLLCAMYNLSPDQVRCLFRAYCGDNLFITGPAGTGKSFIMVMIRDMLVGMGRRVARTASTGTAAINIGGSTIHSFAGIGINEHLHSSTLTRWADDRGYVWENFYQLATLMIDEISMLNNNQVGLVEAVARFMRNNHREAAGGLQFIVCGDFLQLPPVKGAFAFTSEAWARLNFRPCLLETSHRQTDPLWYNMLCQLRRGQLDGYTQEQLLSRIVSADTAAASDCTQLFSKRDKVQKVNEERLALVEGTERIYFAVTDVFKLTGNPTEFVAQHQRTLRGNSVEADRYDVHFKVGQRLVLKVGAKVMIVDNNIEAGYANGTIGIVEELKDSAIDVRVEGLDKPVTVLQVEWKHVNVGKREMYSRKQFPLSLAYAITIHKAQGLGLARARTSLRRNEIFQPGQGYVSLSRVQTLAGLQLDAFEAGAIRAHEASLAFYRQLEEQEQKEREHEPRFRFCMKRK